MKVMKFGGSSVANATNMSRVLDIVEAAAADGRVILVSSAISGCTDTLIEIGRLASEGDPSYAALAASLQERHKVIITRLFTGEERAAALEENGGVFAGLKSLADTICAQKSITDAQKQHIQTFGEVFSTRILAAKLAAEDIPALWLDSRDLVRVSSGKLDEKLTYGNIAAAVSGNPGVKVFVAPGFIARDEQDRPTTLGRGGSDYSAAIYAAATNAASLQIWTDVPGIMTTNPKVVPAARTIPQMAYGSALCMAEHGAKVLYAPTIAPAMAAGIAINIKNTFDPAHPGTMIEALPPRKICQWMGLSNMTEGEDELLCLTAEGPIDAESAVKRATLALKDAGISAIRTSVEESCITVSVRKAVSKQACAALHKEFFEEARSTSVDVYIAGHGSVGRALERFIAAGVGARGGKEIRLKAISSDRSFVDKVIAEAPRRSVFVDCTNSEDIFMKYVPLLEAGINIVSSNRRSLSVPYVEYAAMKHAAMRNGCFLRYSTTVGNALPILESVSGEAANSGDIVSIEAVVSCTLNHIITGYDGANTDSFAKLLQKAQIAGLTEQDPRLDLGGKDALRKLLIIAREAGVPLEAEDVEITPMLPKEFFDCSLDEFYAKLEASEPEFIRREAELDAIDKRQRFVASLRKDPRARNGYKAEIKMQLVGIDSPFYWISGTENVTIINSEFSAPLVIKGAGEGAREAASGVINDIIK